MISSSKKRETKKAAGNKERLNNLIYDVIQGVCGTSYAFAPVAVFEALYYFQKSKLISLSEQQIIDCTSTGKSKFLNYGCRGGSVENVYF